MKAKIKITCVEDQTDQGGKKKIGEKVRFLGVPLTITDKKQFGKFAIGQEIEIELP